MKIVRENINFERGLDPKKSMGLGLKAQIEKYMNEKYGLDYGSIGFLENILEDSDLDRKTREKWIKYILSEGYDFDYSEWYEMRQQQIDVLDIIPELDKELNVIKLRKRGNNYSIKFSDWADFAEFFDNNEMFGFFSKVLNGDAFSFFEDNSYQNYKREDIEGFIADNDIDETLLIDKFEELGGADVEEMWDEIWEDPDFERIKDALQIAAGNATASAEESESRKGLRKSIDDWYDLGKENWDEKTQEYTATVSKQGAERLLDYYFLGENGIEHREPEFYSANWDPGTFQDELENQLENR